IRCEAAIRGSCNRPRAVRALGHFKAVIDGCSTRGVRRSGPQQLRTEAPDRRGPGLLWCGWSAGGLGVADGRTNDPDAPVLWVGAVPNPPACRHLVLPLLEGLTSNLALRELALQPVLALRILWGCWALRQDHPHLPHVRSGDTAKILPAFRGVVGREPGFPAARRRGWCDAVTSAGGHLSCHPQAKGRARSRRRSGWLVPGRGRDRRGWKQWPSIPGSTGR
ncbi:MAG: hypothetical protein QOE61_3136, partial [Micromonosporaceae bacterium]|nr:hypothetical protein [Micromonosporaceae bacterium]